KSSAVGLDIGTSRIVAARNAGQDIKYDIQLNAFVTIPYSKMTENVLQRASVPYTIDANEILVNGNESEQFAGMFNKETRRPMTRGLLNPDEPDSVRLIREITASLAKKAPKDAKLCFSVPAALAGAEENLTYHEATIRQIVGELGYEATSINEGLAVVYAEL